MSASLRGIWQSGAPRARAGRRLGNEIKKERQPTGCLSFFGDPIGTRTRVTAVKGRCLNRLTMGPIALLGCLATTHKALIEYHIYTEMSSRISIKTENVRFQFYYIKQIFDKKTLEFSVVYEIRDCSPAENRSQFGG